MQGVPEQFEFSTDRAEYRSIKTRTGVELYRAHIVRYSFEPHTHEAYAFGAIESGVERIRCNGSDYLATPDSLVLMNPDALHTGQAETEGGWVYRMIYIEPDVLTSLTGESEWWFPDMIIEADKKRAQRLSSLLAALWQTNEPLAFDSLLYQIILEVQPHSKTSQTNSIKPTHRFAPVLEFIQENFSERLVLEELAAVAELSPFHFLRQFQIQYGVTPHQMVMAKRLHFAKHLLNGGMASVDVAAAAGLTDQSHLNRAFARRYGTTPVRYQRQIRQ